MLIEKIIINKQNMSAMSIKGKKQDRSVHPFVEQIRDKILNIISYKIKEGFSLSQIGDLCNLDKVQIHELTSGKRGANLTLNMAFKVWKGLGGDLIELIADLEPNFPWGRIINMKEVDREVVLEVIDRMDNEEDDQEAMSAKTAIRAVVKGLPPRKDKAQASPPPK